MIQTLKYDSTNINELVDFCGWNNIGEIRPNDYVLSRFDYYTVSWTVEIFVKNRNSTRLNYNDMIMKDENNRLSIISKDAYDLLMKQYGRTI